MRLILAVLTVLSLCGTALAETMVAALNSGAKSRTFDANPVFEPRSVLVVGDSLSIYLGERIEDAFKSRPNVAVSRLSKVSSGLAVPSFFNWNEQLQNLSSRNQPDLVLIMLGANDNKSLRDDAGHPLIFGGPGWDAEYASRAQRLIDICRAHNPNARIFWIGAPVMAKAQFDREIQHINDVVRAQCARNAGVFFVNTRDVLADENGDFAKFKTSATGKDIRVRADDGVHVTPAGAALLAQRSLDAVAANGGAVIHGLPPLKEPIRIAPVAENGEPIKMRQVAAATQAAKAPIPDKTQQTASLPMRQVKPQMLSEKAHTAPVADRAPELAFTPPVKHPAMHQVKPVDAEPTSAQPAAAEVNQATPLLAMASAPQPEQRNPIQPVTTNTMAAKPYEIRVKMHQVKPLPERELLAAQQVESEPAPATPPLRAVAKAQPEAGTSLPETDAERVATERALTIGETNERAVAATTPERTEARVDGNYAVQESAWENKALAEKHAQALQKKGLTARVITADLGAKGTWHRVLIGGCENERMALALQQDLQQRFNMKNTLIRKLG
jgi:hypothetical protein